MQADTVMPSKPEIMTMNGLFVGFDDVNRTNDPKLPADPDHMNDLRAQQADSILVECEGQCPEDVGIETLSYLLSKMGHWCDRNGFKMADAMKMAGTSYSEDTTNEGRQFTT